MDVREVKPIEVITDVLCDICDQSTKLEFATLSATWGYFSQSDGEQYKLQLCDKYFFDILAVLKKNRQYHINNEGSNHHALKNFGLNYD